MRPYSDTIFIKDLDVTPAYMVATPVAAQQYQCDGRTHCSQMSSAREAQLFLDNSLGTAMDGDNDGISVKSSGATNRT